MWHPFMPAAIFYAHKFPGWCFAPTNVKLYENVSTHVLTGESHSSVAEHMLCMPKVQSSLPAITILEIHMVGNGERALLEIPENYNPSPGQIILT